MRILLVGALCVPLIGCACAPSPRTTQKACTSKRCLHRTAAVASTAVSSGALKSSPATPATKPALEAASNTKSISPVGSSRNDDKTDSSIAISSDSTPSHSSSDGSDPVLRKAKSTIASKMDDPASALRGYESGDENRRC